MHVSLTRGTLDAQQAAIVAAVVRDPFVVATAGAGTGKTFTTIASVIELIERHAASIDEFALITFTNLAADELRERLQRAFEAEARAAPTPDQRRHWRMQQERVAAAYVGTIHGFCVRILRTWGYRELVAREAAVSFGSFRRSEAFMDVVEAALTGEHQWLGQRGAFDWQEHDLRQLISQIDTTIRNLGLDHQRVLEATLAQPDDDGKPFRTTLMALVETAARHYWERRVEDQIIDAHDQLARAVALLESPSGPEVADQLARRVRYLFVDEFQDTDRLQKRLLDRLAPRMQRTLVVGDRKQSIYGFRAADASLLAELAREHALTPLPLATSRRATRALLAAQNCLFATLRDWFPDLDEPLEPFSEAAAAAGELPPLVWVPGGRDRDERIAATASVIRELVGSRVPPDVLTPGGQRDRVAPHDIALLARSNWQLLEYEAGLAELLAPDGIRVRRVGGGAFFQQPEIAHAYRLLLLLQRYPDDTLLSMVLDGPWLRGVDRAEAERRLLEDGAATPDRLTWWFERHYPEQRDRLATLRAAALTDTVPQLLARAGDTFAIADYYHERGDAVAVAHLEKLREIARQLFSEEQALTLRQFTDWLRIAILTQRNEATALLEEPDAAAAGVVRLLTVHQAKGLEFPVVIVPELQRPLASEWTRPIFLVDGDEGLDLAVEQAVLPTASARFAERVERDRALRVAEELRLLYVALTRARGSAVLVGSRLPAREQPPATAAFSWQDAVRRAWPALVERGAEEWPAGRR